MGLESSRPKSRFDLSDLGFLDDVRVSEMDMLCRLAAIASNADAALMVVADDLAGCVRIKGAFGIGRDTLAQSNFNISGSLLGQVREDSRLISVSSLVDTGEVPSDLEKLRASAFVGAPVHGPAGEPVGTLALFSHMPRTWRPEDVRCVRDASALASKQILMRAALATLKLVTRYDQIGSGHIHH